MNILAIETSCDETSIAILKGETSPKIEGEVLSHALNSQIELHKEYGGVYPTIAKREHAKNIIPLLAKALTDADMSSSSAEVENVSEEKKEKVREFLSREPELAEALITLSSQIKKPDIDHIAITYGPGLEPALWVGVTTAQAISALWDIPIIPVNHMEGHIFSVFKKENQFEIPEVEFPLLSLLISGGHTQLVLVKNWGEYEIIGETRDDAVGESFDKVARMLGLSYPGGPEISKHAQNARENNVTPNILLPRPMLHYDNLDFSFSGLKTAVLYELKKHDSINEDLVGEISLEFENAVSDVLEKKVKHAITQYNPSTLILGGGVSANKHIQKTLENLCKESGVTFLSPEKDIQGDNAIMIGIAGLSHIENSLENPDALKANGNTRL